jgi:hypothetical protein
VQVPRIARARGVDAATVRALIERHVDHPTLFVIGEPHVNVLTVNLELDRIFRRETTKRLPVLALPAFAAPCLADEPAPRAGAFVIASSPARSIAAGIGSSAGCSARPTTSHARPREPRARAPGAGG